MNQPDNSPSHGTRTDDALRQAMQHTLAQPQQGPGLDVLASRVLAQWEQRTASASSVGPGPVASLRRTLARRQVQMGLASLTIIAAVAVQTSWTRPDPALEDLMEPDVLSLISLGEL